MKQITRPPLDIKYLAYSITLALSVTASTTLLADENQTVELAPLEIIANPVIKENHLDAFSSISSVVTDDQLRDQNALD